MGEGKNRTSQNEEKGRVARVTIADNSIITKVGGLTMGETSTVKAVGTSDCIDQSGVLTFTFGRPVGASNGDARIHGQTHQCRSGLETSHQIHTRPCIAKSDDWSCMGQSFEMATDRFSAICRRGSNGRPGPEAIILRWQESNDNRNIEVYCFNLDVWAVEAQRPVKGQTSRRVTLGSWRALTGFSSGGFIFLGASALVSDILRRPEPVVISMSTSPAHRLRRSRYLWLSLPVTCSVIEHDEYDKCLTNGRA